MAKFGVVELNNFLNGLPGRLDFEIATKTNPLDENGNVIQGKHQVVYVYLKYGKYKKTKITDLVIKKMAEDEKRLPTKEETPFEQNLRDYAKSLSEVETPLPVAPPTPAIPPVAPPLPTPPPTPPPPPAPLPTSPTIKLPPPTGYPEFIDYVTYVGSPDVFDRTTGRYISASEGGNIPNFWIRVLKAKTVRPEVKTESDFAVWAGKNLTNFPV